MKKFIVFLLIFSSLAQADQESVALKAGDKAPYDGILLSIPRAERVRLMDIDLTSCLKISDLKDKELSIQDLRITNANKTITELSEKVSKKEDSLLSSIGMFLLGAATATLITYGVSQTIRQ